tara:strand:- start:79 stop:777 length:699 start_codon:yes stop_codon:yes gene_type:complete
MNHGNADNFIYRLKHIIKKNPKLFHILNHTLGTFVGKSAKASIAHLPKGSLIVNIGSGAEVIRDDVVNLDCIPYPGVKIVGDANNMPFKDNFVDAVICESLLEHVLDPKVVLNEVYRVLKPGGMMYLSIPFIIPFHSSPHDYYRWTAAGSRELLKDFQEQEFGILNGPTNAMTYVLREWLALALSFNINTLRQMWILIFMIIFAPINLLDYVFVHFKGSKDLAHIYYFIVSK